MKRYLGLAMLGVGALILLFVSGDAVTYGQEADTAAPTRSVTLSGDKELSVHRGYTSEQAQCIECHAKETPGIVEGWRLGRMAHVCVSCWDCHVVESDSPVAGQCEGIKGTKTYISPMVSPKACAKCHPSEVEQFSKSGHAKLASAPVVDNNAMKKLMYHFEGAGFLGNPETALSYRSSRATGCQMCHGTEVELGLDRRPVKETWPGGVGQRYPDGGIGNCTVCHTRHIFSLAEARRPEACASCHLGPDHPDIEIYESSKHGQMFHAHSEKWTWDSAPDTWEPGDYTAPSCATCHMSGTGRLATTHNVNERLKWNLMTPRSEIRSGERGEGLKARENMLQVCSQCHSSLHTNTIMKSLDGAVELYNLYFDKAAAMLEDLKAKNLVKEAPWKDPFQELYYYLWHHTGRRARQGAAMNGPDYAHWHGFFQIFQVYKDMEDIYNRRIETNTIEELSPVMSTGPL